MTVVVIPTIVLIFVFWAFIKNKSLKYLLNIMLLLAPALLILDYGFYTYSLVILMALMSSATICSFHRFENNINKKKLLLPIPFFIFVVYLAKNTDMRISFVHDYSEIFKSTLLVIFSLFIAGVGSLLIMTRTKGENINDE